jgi:hypothetical protein
MRCAHCSSCQGDRARVETSAKKNCACNICHSAGWVGRVLLLAEYDELLRSQGHEYVLSPSTQGADTYQVDLLDTQQKVYEARNGTEVLFRIRIRSNSVKLVAARLFLYAKKLISMRKSRSAIHPIHWASEQRTQLAIRIRWTRIGISQGKRQILLKEVRSLSIKFSDADYSGIERFSISQSIALVPL